MADGYLFPLLNFMKRLAIAFTVLFAVFLFSGSLLGASAAPGKAGLWSLTASSAVTGSPPELVQRMNTLSFKQTGQICVTPEEVARNKPNDAPIMPASDRDCQVTNIRSTEHTYSADGVCTPQSQKGVSTFESIHDAEHFTQKSVTTLPGRDIHVTDVVEGQWLSDDCGALSRPRQ